MTYKGFRRYFSWKEIECGRMVLYFENFNRKVEIMLFSIMDNIAPPSYFAPIYKTGFAIDISILTSTWLNILHCTWRMATWRIHSNTTWL